MFLKLDDADLFVTACGPGPRTLVAHGGWVGSGELWAFPFELLSRSWRCITYDHRGTGATVNRAPRITFELLVQDLFRVLDAQGVERCVLAGESSGAMIVLEAALRAPERFSGLVLVDGRYKAGRSVAGARFLDGCRTDFPATMDLFIDACITDEGAQAELAWGRKIVLRSTGPQAIELMEGLEDVHLEDRLQELSMPTLILHGSRDKVTPIEHSQALARAIPNSRFIVIEGAGHVPTMTRPRDVTSAIEEFFA